MRMGQIIANISSQTFTIYTLVLNIHHSAVLSLTQTNMLRIESRQSIAKYAIAYKKRNYSPSQRTRRFWLGHFLRVLYVQLGTHVLNCTWSRDRFQAHIFLFAEFSYFWLKWDHRRRRSVCSMHTYRCEDYSHSVARGSHSERSSYFQVNWANSAYEMPRRVNPLPGRFATRHLMFSRTLFRKCIVEWMCAMQPENKNRIELSNGIARDSQSVSQAARSTSASGVWCTPAYVPPPSAYYMH